MIDPSVTRVLQLLSIEIRSIVPLHLSINIRSVLKLRNTKGMIRRYE